jgi:cell wall-associated NlpC family hydrolase
MTDRITASDFVLEARKLVGVRYRHQGHSDIGVDCLGFLYVAATRAGVPLDRMLAQIRRPDGDLGHRWNYSRRGTPHLLESVQQLCRPSNALIPGCLLFFQFPHARDPQHFAIYSGNSMIHAHAMRRCVVEHGYRSQWIRWTHSRWLLSGIRYE